MSTRRLIALVGILIAVCGALPLVTYWYSIGRIQTVTVKDAVAMLNTSNVVLVDVRSAEDYRAGHVDGAVSWSFDDILFVKTKDDLPPEFKDQTLLLLCDSGIAGAWAVQQLERIGFANAYNVHGGMQTWIANSSLGASPYAQMCVASGERVPLPFRNSPIGAQAAVALAGYFVKPIYMALSLLVAIVLWFQKSHDMKILAWSMVFFFVGESACWVNFLFLNEQSHPLEYIHSFGMVLCLGFLAFAFIEVVDRRIVGFTDPNAKCAFLGLCHGCIKYKPVPCGLHRLFGVGIPALIVLAAMPLNAATYAVSYNTWVFGFFHNYAHSVLYQLYETRFCPLMAIALLAAALVLFLVKKDNLLLSKVFLAAAIGHLGFAFLRLMFFQFYRDDLVWFAFWEETTELILIAAIICVLVIFRQGLVPSLRLSDWFKA